LAEDADNLENVDPETLFDLEVERQGSEGASGFDLTSLVDADFRSVFSSQVKAIEDESDKAGQNVEWPWTSNNIRGLVFGAQRLGPRWFSLGPNFVPLS
jgi:hypothetical protein